MNETTPHDLLYPLLCIRSDCHAVDGVRWMHYV